MELVSFYPDEDFRNYYESLVGENPSDLEDRIAIISELAHNQHSVGVNEQWSFFDENLRRAKKEWKNVPTEDNEEEVKKWSALTRMAADEKDRVLDYFARLAEKFSDNSPIIKTYENTENLGEATFFSDAEELSLEWLNNRKYGIGGSSVSEAAGISWRSNPGNVKLMTDDEIHRQWLKISADKATKALHDSHADSGVLARGHQWERALVEYAAWWMKDEETKVATTKYTWKGKNDNAPQIINVDGLIIDETDTPVGIVECKTASREFNWRYGVPINYRMQVLWYLDATGLDYAYIVVRFDSGKISVFKIHADDPVDEKIYNKDISEIRYLVAEKWEEYAKYRDNPEKLWDAYEPLKKDDLEIGDDKKDDSHPFVWVEITPQAPYHWLDEHFTCPVMGTYLVIDNGGDIIDSGDYIFPHDEVILGPINKDNDKSYKEVKLSDFLDDIAAIQERVCDEDNSSCSIVAADSYTWDILDQGDISSTNFSALFRKEWKLPGATDSEMVHLLKSKFS